MKSINIVIIDYGVGNTYSVSNAITCLGYNRVVITDKEEVLRAADALILPGVGAFDEAMRNLQNRNLLPVLNELVLNEKKPILGICVGMQMLASSSEENGLHLGLNWIEGTVKKLDLPEGFTVPHVGWNEVNLEGYSPLFLPNGEKSHFYFDHSYWFDCGNEYITAWCDYGVRVTAAVQKENIFGVQFHPEKSQNVGLKLFRRFFNSLS